MMIDVLEEILTLENYTEHMDEIDRLAKSRDECCRYRLAELLCRFPNWHAEKTLLSLTEDPSYLVQTNALDSLSAFPGDASLEAAMRLSSSRHPLVRGHAYICMGMVYYWADAEKCANVRNRLIAKKESDTFAKICKTESLIRLGMENLTDPLIRMFSRCRYQNQCAILNSLSDLYPTASHAAQKKIRQFSEELAGRDMDTAVQEAYDRLTLAIMEADDRCL